MKIYAFTAYVLLALTTTVAVADTIELNNGKTFEGTFTSRDGDNIKFDVDGIPMTFSAGDVKNISMGASAQSSGEEKDAAGAEKDQATQKSTIPAGTLLVIRIADTLDPSKHKDGHKLTAKLESALVIDGETIVPVDSNVYGVVLEAKTSRRVAGQ